MSYAALGFHFKIGQLDDSVAEEILRVLRPLARPGTSPVNVFDIHRLPSGHLEFAIDGVPQLASKNDAVITHLVVAELTARALQSRHDHLVLHAGAVVLDGRTILVSGRSGAGKSTLTVALIDAGGRYLSDEAVVIDGNGQVVEALGRCPQLDRNSRSILGDARWASIEHPDTSSYVEMAGPEQWSDSSPPAATVVVFVGATPPQTDGTAVARLIGDAFEPFRRTQDGLDRVARLVSSSVIVAPRRGEPAEMVRAIRQALVTSAAATGC
ncbi:MAG: hypothetical protein ACI9N0_002893 [Ilumatobacter sp.]|jgi:hypothetical protein